MIYGFTKQTKPLTASEKEAVGIIVAVLSKAHGIKNAVRSPDLAIMCGLNTVRIRKVVNYIRTQGLVPCLIASSFGYYIAENAEEVIAYEESLRGRESAIRQVRERIEEQRVRKFGVELNDPSKLF